MAWWQNNWWSSEDPLLLQKVQYQNQLKQLDDQLLQQNIQLREQSRWLHELQMQHCQAEPPLAEKFATQEAMAREDATVRSLGSNEAPSDAGRSTEDEGRMSISACESESAGSQTVDAACQTIGEECEPSPPVDTAAVAEDMLVQIDNSNVEQEQLHEAPSPFEALVQQETVDSEEDEASDVPVPSDGHSSDDGREAAATEDPHEEAPASSAAPQSSEVQWHRRNFDKCQDAPTAALDVGLLALQTELQRFQKCLRNSKMRRMSAEQPLSTAQAQALGKNMQKLQKHLDNSTVYEKMSQRQAAEKPSSTAQAEVSQSCTIVGALPAASSEKGASRVL
eukprot:s5774_g1.t2